MMKRCLAPVIVAAVLTGAAFGSVSTAEAHTLSGSKAKRVTKAFTFDLWDEYELDPYSDDGDHWKPTAYSVGPCRRRTAHRVDCRRALFFDITEADDGSIEPWICSSTARVSIPSYGYRAQVTSTYGTHCELDES